MPGRTLPTFSLAEVASHNTRKSCWVTIGNRVYDVTDFVDDHPGGADFVLDYAGKDIRDILKDGTSHTHSEAAYEVLEESEIGILETAANGNGVAKGANGHAKAGANGLANGNGNGKAPNGDAEWVHPRTGMSNADDLSKDTDYEADFKRHKFLDLNKPLFPQVWCGGFSKEFYLDQIHRPRHYKGGKSAPLFGNFLEPLSLTPWWVVPMLWLPVVSYLTYLASDGMSRLELVATWLLGVGVWSLLEYVLHRFLFHLDEYLPDNRVGITLHFTLHGIHHYLPMDKYRLVMPPTLFVVLAAPFWRLAHIVLPWSWHAGTAGFAGGVFGYICYDLTHYFLHHENLPLWYKQLKKYHLQHHYFDYENGFGVTSRFWDRVFGTELVDPDVKKMT